MRIAIDIAPLKTNHKYRGIGFYTKNLIWALKKYKPENEYIFFTRTADLPKNADLAHYPYFDLFYYTLPLIKRLPTVVTIHDLIPLVFPDKFPRGIKGEIKWQLQKLSLKTVSAIITDSANSKKDIVKFTRFPEEKIHVVHLAPGEEFKLQATSYKLQAKTRRKYSLPERFVLYVGDVNWNKNVPGLIKAFKQLTISTFEEKIHSGKVHVARRTCQPLLAAAATPGVETRATSEVKLVLVGKAFLDEKLKESREINRLIDKLRIENSVLKLGFVPTEDLVAIYNLAAVYCQPSFYEGFGLPTLEAMACGTPAVVADIPVLRKACGKAAVYVDPYNVEDIAREVFKVLRFDTFKYRSVADRGLKRAKRFSWRKVAGETVEVYEKVIKGD